MEQKINTPFPFGFGIDIISAKKVSLKTLKTSFIRRILSAEEIKIYLSMKTSHEKIAFLKGRWAAKEALVKALGFFLPFPKINIFYDNEVPRVVITNYNVSLSISHERDFTIAGAVVFSQN